MNKRDLLQYWLYMTLASFLPRQLFASAKMPSRHKTVSIYAFNPEINMKQFANNCNKWGVDQAILHPGFFDKNDSQKILAQHKLSLWLNLPVFYNPAFLKSNPEYYSITSKGRRAIHDWCHFVCPSRQDYIEREIETNSKLAKTLEPERISLDFIRFFVFWELVGFNDTYLNIEDGCYCQQCLDNFSKATGIDLPAKNAAAFIRKNKQKTWAAWKSGLINNVASSYIDSLRTASPHSSIWMKTIPWKPQDIDGAITKAAGQDIGNLSKLVDGITPMAFTHILQQTPEWKVSLLNHVKNTTGKPVVSYLQVSKLIRNSEIPLAQFEAELQQGLAGNNAGLVIFHYDQLVTAPSKAALLAQTLRT